MYVRQHFRILYLEFDDETTSPLFPINRKNHYRTIDKHNVRYLFTEITFF